MGDSAWRCLGKGLQVLALGFLCLRGFLNNHPFFEVFGGRFVGGLRGLLDGVWGRRGADNGRA